MPSMQAKPLLLIVCLLAVACWAQSPCFQFSIVPFSTVADPTTGLTTNYGSTDVTWSIYKDNTPAGGTPEGGDLGFGQTRTLCGLADFHVTVSENTPQSENQTRTGWLVVNGHRMYTFSRPAITYHSVWFSTTGSNAITLKYATVDGKVFMEAAKTLDFTKCRSLSVIILENQNAFVKVKDSANQLAYYVYGKGNVLNQPNKPFLPEICYLGNYTIELVHQPYSSCKPTTLTWKLEYDSIQRYARTFYQKEIVTFLWTDSDVVFQETQLFGSATPSGCKPGEDGSSEEATGITWHWILPLTGVLVGVVVVAFRDKICSYDFKRRYCSCRRRRYRRNRKPDETQPLQEGSAVSIAGTSAPSSYSDDSADSSKAAPASAGDDKQQEAVKAKKRFKLSDILE